jgi:hypothetical protein
MPHAQQHLRRAIAVLIVAAVSPIAAGASSAAATTNPSPNQQVVGISESHVGPIPISLASAAAAAPTEKAAAALRQAATTSTTCWYYDDSRSAHNVFGTTLWTFTTRTSWCGDGSWIRNYAYTTTTASSVLGWKYYGLVINWDNYGVNWSQFESIRQGQFCLLNCLAQNYTPYIDVRVGPAGQIYHN